MELIWEIWNNIWLFLQSIMSEWFHDLVWNTPLMMGVLLQLLVIVLIIIIIRVKKHWKFKMLFELMVEKVYEFFEEILEETGKRWIKVYIVTLFFVILLFNLLSWVLDIIRVMFVDIEAISKYIQIPTTSFEFNIAVAVVSIALFLIAQFRHLWSLKFFLEYLPINGKGILDISRDDVKWFMYWPAKILIKSFDIIISMFVGILDIVGVFAKVISLSARLYGNMIAGWVLLTFMVMGVNSLTQNLISADFPLLAPLILYAQWLLVALIQAFVFPLLVAIFMKLAQTSGD